MAKFFKNPSERDAAIAKIDAAGALLNMAPATKGRLPISFGIPSVSAKGGVPQVAVSVDRNHVWRFYNNDTPNGLGILVHEQLGNDELRAWAERQAGKFIQFN